MGDDRRKAERRSAPIVAIAALALSPIAYVLSVGPVGQMVMRGYLPEPIYQWLYAPLIFLYRHSRVCHDVLECYDRLWH